MGAEKAIEIEGTITSVLPGTMFRVSLNGALPAMEAARPESNPVHVKCSPTFPEK